MLSNYSHLSEVLIYLVTGIIFILITLGISSFIRPARPNPEKQSTYESGEEPITSPWSQFNIRFYLIAIIFLLFEIELILLFPMTTVFSKVEAGDEVHRWNWYAWTEMVIFIVILGLGLVYAWGRGFLEWSKPDPKTLDINSPVPKQLYSNLNSRFAGKKSTT